MLINYGVLNIDGEFGMTNKESPLFPYFQLKKAFLPIVFYPNFTALFAGIGLKKGLYLCNRSRERYPGNKL
jgi:hypothetical protein